MDAAAGKPFGFDRSPLDRTVAPEVLNFSRLILLRETSRSTRSRDDAVVGQRLGLEQPARKLVRRAVDLGQRDRRAASDLYRRRAGPRGSRVAVAGRHGTDHLAACSAPDDPLWGFAVLDANGQPTALATALAGRPVPGAAENARYGPANPFTEYRGAWRFGPLGADVGNQQDSQALFRFTGSDVALQLRQDDFVAYFFAEVDGQPANALPVDGGGNAYVILTSDTRQPETGLTLIARGLGPGEHELRLIADRGWDRWTLMGFAASSGSLSAPYVSLLAVALGTSFIALIAVIVSATRLNWGRIGRAVGRLWAALGTAGQMALSALATVALLIGMLLGFGGLLPEALRRDPAALGLTAGAALVLYASPALFVSLAAAVVLFVIFYHRPDIGLMLTIFCAPFYLFPVELYRFAFPMAELVLLLLAGAWALRETVEWARARQSAGRDYPGSGIMGFVRQWTWLDVGVAAYLGLGVWALIGSAQPGPAITEWRVLFVEPAVFYLILRVTAHRQPGMLLRAVDALLAAALAVALIGLFQFAAGASVIVAEGGSLRLASVYGSPNNAALFLERALPFAFIMLMQRGDRRRRIVAGAIFVMSGTALALTLSAGALFLGVPAALAVVLILQFGKRGLLALAGLGLLFAGGFALALQSERFARLANLGAGTSFFRVRVWQSAAQMITDYPITGIGLDQFLYRYRGQYIAPDAWQEPNLSHPHQIALDFWLRLGLLGALLLLFLQMAFWFRSLSIWRHTAHAERARRALIIGAMGSMAGLLVHGMVDNSVFVNDLALVFMLLLAIPASLAASRTLPSSDGV